LYLSVDRILNQQKLDRAKREAEARELRQRAIEQPVERLVEKAPTNDSKELPAGAPKAEATPSPSGGLLTNIKQIFRSPPDTPRSIPQLPGAFPTTSGPFESFTPKPTPVDSRARVTPSLDIGRLRKILISYAKV
jgi:hypothetical protein